MQSESSNKEQNIFKTILMSLVLWFSTASNILAFIKHAKPNLLYLRSLLYTLLYMIPSL